MSVVSFVSSGKFLGAAAGAAGSAIGLISLSLFTAALITFPAWPITAGLPAAGSTNAGLTGAGFWATPSVSVNRALKGDRLPINIPAGASPLHPISLPRSRLPDESQPAPAQPRTRAQIPLGCDAAFSPISSPLLAHVFRRCVV
jgi:hypothetical protein